MRRTGNVALMGVQRKDAYNIFLGKHERKRELGRPRHRMQYYIKIGIQEIWRGGPFTGFIGLKLTLRSLTLYIYGAPILDVSRSNTTTQHSR